MGIRLAAIDVGSNAIRFALGELVDKKNIKVIHSYRVPVRLGRDSFSKGIIGDESMKALLRAFIEFQKLMIKYDVKYYKAIATSALRDAKNSNELVDLIFATSHIQLDIIDGKEEARLVHLGVSHVENISKKNALLIDIGGGSVEFIVSVNGKVKSFQSINMGTVRLLQKFKKVKHNEKLIKTLRQDVRKKLKSIHKYKRYFKKRSNNKVFIGTGGNVKALNRISKVIFRNSENDQITYFEMELLEKILFGFTELERIEKLKMKTDRADVILPAYVILMEVMQMMGFPVIRSPDIGLKDGILIQLAKF